MLMEICNEEDTCEKFHTGEATVCNTNYYWAAQKIGLDPWFMRIDKEFAEITTAPVLSSSFPGVIVIGKSKIDGGRGVFGSFGSYQP
jgi:hypothetical protein